MKENKMKVIINQLKTLNDRELVSLQGKKLIRIETIKGKCVSMDDCEEVI